MAIFGSTMSATPQCGVKIGPNLAPSKQFLKPDDARKGYHEPTMPTRHLSKSQGPQNYEGQGQEGSMCAVSLIAIELKGLAAPGEALKITASFGRDANNNQLEIFSRRAIVRGDDSKQ